MRVQLGGFRQLGMQHRIVAGDVRVVEREQGGLDQNLLHERGLDLVLRLRRRHQQQNAGEGCEQMHPHGSFFRDRMRRLSPNFHPIALRAINRPLRQNGRLTKTPIHQPSRVR